MYLRHERGATSARALIFIAILGVAVFIGSYLLGSTLNRDAEVDDDNAGVHSTVTIGAEGQEFAATRTRDGDTWLIADLLLSQD